MIVGREQTQTLASFDQMLHRGAGDRSSVERTRSATELVHDDKASSSGAAKGRRRFSQLNEEGTLIHQNSVGRTKTREDAIDWCQFACFCWHKATELRQYGDQACLAE